MRPLFDRKIFTLAATLFGGLATLALAGCSGTSATKDAGGTLDAAKPDTRNDVVVPDAHPDVSADVPESDLPDVPPDTVDAGCAADALIYCTQRVSSTASDIVICSDYAKPASCIDGKWTCEAGDIDSGQCDCSLFAAPNCQTCTKHGWVCSDGGADGPDAADDASLETSPDLR